MIGKQAQLGQKNLEERRCSFSIVPAMPELPNLSGSGLKKRDKTKIFRLFLSTVIKLSQAMANMTDYYGFFE